MILSSSHPMATICLILSFRIWLLLFRQPQISEMEDASGPGMLGVYPEIVYFFASTAPDKSQVFPFTGFSMGN